jgi:hypothetical protein
MSEYENENFINSTLQVEIKSFSEKTVNQKLSTYFDIQMQFLYTKKTWLLEKDYEDFVNLQNEFNLVLPNPPNIEGKSLFKVKAYEGLTKRKNNLEKFLRECCLRKDVINTDAFQLFVDLKDNAPQLICEKPKLISEFNDLPLGIRDCIYLKEENIIFIILSDMNIASRVDAYITNVNLPWEKKTEAHISVGAFFAFRVHYDTNKGYKFQKLFAKSFPEQTHCLNFDKESNTINIGLDSGRIFFYKLNPDSNYSQYENYIDFKPHKSAVTGINYDAKTGYIYSISSDKKFLITEIGYLDNPNEIIEGPAGFTYMYRDKQNDRMILCNDIGMVSIYLITNFPPSLLNNIQISSDYSIRGFDINFIKSYLFTASSNGQITILDINKPGKERLIKEISNFGGSMKLNVVKYLRDFNQLLTGDENGRVIVWNLKTGKCTYAWKAHKGGLTQLDYLEDKNYVMTVGKDKYVKVWSLPYKWENEDIVLFEQNEIKIMSDTIAMIKLQKSLNNSDDYNSEEDSINGWDYRPDFE